MLYENSSGECSFLLNPPLLASPFSDVSPLFLPAEARHYAAEDIKNRTRKFTILVSFVDR